MARRRALLSIFRDVLSPSRVGLMGAHFALLLLPDFSSGWIRSRLYRLLGIDMSPDVFIMGNLRFRVGRPHHIKNLHIHPRARISTDVTINCDADITIGEKVLIGPYVKIYTTTHLLGPGSERCLPDSVSLPVVIEKGAWLALGVTVLPGVTIGHGAVVASGAVVTESVPPNTLSGGVPAKVIRNLPFGDR